MRITRLLFCCHVSFRRQPLVPFQPRQLGLTAVQFVHHVVDRSQTVGIFQLPLQSGNRVLESGIFNVVHHDTSATTSIVGLIVGVAVGHVRWRLIVPQRKM